MTAARLLVLVALWVAGLTSAVARAQELVKQPHCAFLLVDLHSLRDDVQLQAGPGHDAPYLYRGWTRGQMVELSEAGDFATLRVWDRALTAEGRTEAETWKLELMPAAPLAFVVRSHGGRGDYELGGMPLRNLSLFCTSVDLRLAFDQPAPQRLELAWASLHAGELVLQQFLNARPERALFDLEGCKARIELNGDPFAGEVEVVVSGVPASLELVLRRDVGIDVEAPPAVLRAFAASHLNTGGAGLRSQGYDTAACRLRLRFRTSIPGLRVQWEGEEAAAAGRTEPNRDPTPPAAMSADADPAFEAQIVEFLVLVARRDMTAAATKLRDLSALHPGDGRILFLETWLRVHPKPQLDLVPLLAEGEKRFRTGLDFYVQGHYEAALDHFRAAQALDPKHDGIAAWIHKTEAEIQRGSITAPPPLPPSAPPPAPAPAMERVVVATAPPVIALRAPARASTTTRAERFELSGKVGDDAGVDHIEFLVNGEPLRDAAGQTVVLRPRATDSDSTRSMDFAVVIPLRVGANEVVVIAEDKDATAHRTRERVTIRRETPFHRSGAFALLLGALLLLVPAGLLVLRSTRSRGAPGRHRPAAPAGGE